MATAAPARPQVAPTQYAGFWLRFVAAFIDGVIVNIVASVIGAVIGGGSFAALSRNANQDPLTSLPLILSAMSTIILICVALSFGYHAYMESSEKQATLGKMVMGLKVTDLNGQRISFARASGRFFSKIISAMIFYIGFIMAGFTEKKQGLHDMIAGTLVVRTK